MRYSVIIPVFNRPEEADELLSSLSRQTWRGEWEVIVVEDGSERTCREVVERYAERLNVRYFAKPNSGPGPSRNYGVERAQGDYVIILDSDCVLPDTYLEAVDRGLAATPCDAFGGPDRAHESFTPVQRAIGYAMTSFFTTGGIRGGSGAKMDRFFPRSFNMGVRRSVYTELHGFAPMRFGEDIDFSYRIVESGHTARLLPEAWVWHKRRTDFDKFFRQVFNSGIARMNLTRRHPGTFRLVHALPSVFTVGSAMLVLLAVLLRLVAVWMPLLWALLIFVDASVQERSAVVGLLAVEASFVQLTGYGSGLIYAWWEREVRGRGEFAAYEHNFYK